MTTEPFGTELIERYLRARKLRYFRGCHDGEFFFLLTVGHERLHVHLEAAAADHVTVRVTPANFFPAADRPRLQQFIDNWNVESRRATAIVHESSDPTRIGVVVENSYPIGRGMQLEDFAGLADNTIRSAIKLFAEITPTVSAA